MTWENVWERFIPVPGVPTRARQDHLHDERDRVAELPAAEDHQEPRALPHRRRRDKLLWLAIRDIEDKRARARAKEKGLPANERRVPGRLVEEP
jgi:putative transposase